MSDNAGWPVLPVERWEPTRDTLTLWLQIVGKVRLARSPMQNHWWNAPLYLTARGLTTSLIPGGPGKGFAIDLDFIDHRLDIATTLGQLRSMRLEPRPVSAFYAEVMEMLDALELHTEIWPVPVELPDAIAFASDTEHADYDARSVELFWRTLVEVERVFNRFRSRFVGKSSPIHLFWGGLDLATTRFSGRPAPPYSRPVPNCGFHVMNEAYSHEVSSCGYWPGAEGEGIFYSYAYPEPPGYRSMPVSPVEARFDDTLGEFVLPYTDVRTSPDPDGALLDFLQTTYEAAATSAHWDRALERAIVGTD